MKFITRHFLSTTLFFAAILTIASITTLPNQAHASACITDSFCTTWQTTSDGESITIPTYPGGTYNYDVDWGDGNTDAAQAGDATHSYTTAGTYTVSVTGTFPGIYFSNGATVGASKDKIIAINQWGNIHWTSMYGAFNGCTQLVGLATDVPDLSGITDMTTMFLNAALFNQDISNWDVSHVTNMSLMFLGAASFNQNLSIWDVSHVTNMSSMFSATSFNNGGAPLTWGSKTVNVTDMTQMFSQNPSFNQDISGWDVSNVTNMNRMFNDAIRFNNGGQPLAWGSKTANVTEMLNMFSNASSFNQDVSGWDVSNVLTMEGMFSAATDFNNGGQPLAWGSKTANVTNMYYMFSGASSFNQDISGWDVSNVGIMDNMFFTATAFNNGGQPMNWGNKTSHVGTMYGMFSWASSFNQDVSGWDVSNVHQIQYMFTNATSFNNGGQPLNWGSNFSNVTNTFGMFSEASSFNQDISGWDVSNVTDMGQMFSGAIAFNNGGQPMIWGLKTSNVTNMSLMFSGASSFNQDISGWDVSNVTGAGGMFSAATSFNNGGAPLTWGSKTVNVTDMNRMFYGATAFDQDIGGWDIHNATNAAEMFNTATLSPANYDALLAGWSAQPLQNNVVFAAGYSKYCDVASRKILTNTYNWTVYDGGACDKIAVALTSTIKGTTISNNGNPGLTLNTIQEDGSGSINSIDAADTSNTGSFITRFEAMDPQASITKVVKYASGADFSNFTTDAAYNGTDPISGGDFFIVELTPATLAVVYYKINVTVTTVNAPVVTTNAASNIQQNQVTLNGYLTSADFNDVTVFGFQYGTDTNYGSDMHQNAGGGFLLAPQSLSLNLNNLTCGTTYHYRFYVTSIVVGNVYGSDVPFTTSSCSGGGGGGGGGHSDPKPTLTNGSATNIGKTSVTLGATITDSGGDGFTVTSRGMYYLLASNWNNGSPDFHNILQVSENGSFPIGPYTETITELTCGTDYMYIGFAGNNGNGGERIAFPQISFRTSECNSSGGGTLNSSGKITGTQLYSQKTTGGSQSFSRTLKLGMKGDDVVKLQKYLKIIPVSSKIFGPKTKKAVQAFQKAHGLTPDGVVGPKTQSLMK